jgi:hypothetical protein
MTQPSYLYFSVEKTRKHYIINALTALFHLLGVGPVTGRIVQNISNKKILSSIIESGHISGSDFIMADYTITRKTGLIIKELGDEKSEKIEASTKNTNDEYTKNRVHDGKKREEFSLYKQVSSENKENKTVGVSSVPGKACDMPRVSKAPGNVRAVSGVPVAGSK